MASTLLFLALLAGPAGFLKGQLHVHSSNSGDSRTAPADVVRWYASRGYDFIVFTDHEHIAVAPPTNHMLVIPGVELTQNLEGCEPPPPGECAASCTSMRSSSGRSRSMPFEL
jgi:hypothetical protein